MKDVDAPELFSVCDAYVTFGDDMLDEATVTYSAPEDERNRWLAVYPDADTADRALGAISSVIEGCPVEEVKGTETVLTPFASTLGERSFAWTSRYRTGGSFDVGLAVFQAVRVGNAVLLDTNYGEGGATTDSIGKVARAVATDAVPVVKAMDVFAEEPSTVAPPPESSSLRPRPVDLRRHPGGLPDRRRPRLARG